MIRIIMPFSCTRSVMAATFLLVEAFSSAPASAQLCEDQPDKAAMSAFCTVAAPEDLVVYKQTFLIISSLQPGMQLYGFDTRAETLRPLETRLSMPDESQNWGDPACGLPPQLLTHGLDLSRRENGEWQLLAVNHGDRESIEFFAVTQSGSDAPVLQWKGCVMAAENTQFNDVAALPDGGFLATDPITASWKLPRMLAGEFGRASGRVYRWRRGRGYEAVPNTEGAYPNGITLSRDGRRFYLNVYQEDEVREHDLASGKILRRVAVKQPDNSTLTDDGQLLVASHDASTPQLLAALMSDPRKRNTIPYRIVSIDLASFTATVRFATDGVEMGAGTVAVPVADDLYIGAFRGDRLMRVRVPAADTAPAAPAAPVAP